MTESVTSEERETSRSIWPVIVGGWIAVVVIDAGGALVSRATHVPYGYFALLSFALYPTLGIIAAHRRSLTSSAWVGLAVALFDATVGWWISWQIGPGRISVSTSTDVLFAVFAMKFVVAAETLLAFAAGAIWRALRRRRGV